MTRFEMGGYGWQVSRFGDWLDKRSRGSLGPELVEILEGLAAV